MEDRPEPYQPPLTIFLFIVLVLILTQNKSTEENVINNATSPKQNKNSNQSHQTFYGDHF